MAFLCRVVRGAFCSRACSSSPGIFVKGVVASAGPVAAWSEASALHGMRNYLFHADGRAALARSTFGGSRGLHSTAAAKTEQIFRGREGFGLAAERGAHRFHVLRDAVVKHVDDEAQEDDHYTKIAARRGTHQLMREMEREREAYCTTMPDEKAVVQEYMEEDEAMKARFQEWMKEYGRTYKDEVEKARRFKIFKASAKCVDASNAQSIQAGSSARFALNEFADWNAKEMPGLLSALPLTDEEFLQMAKPYLVAQGIWDKVSKAMNQREQQKRVSED